MDKKQKIRALVIMPVIVVLIVLGLVLTGVMIAGAGGTEAPTALASASSVAVEE